MGLAERVGFEPTTPLARRGDLENRRFQPLSHLSIPVNIDGAYLITEARKES